jgi:hypothetical protein
MPLISTSDSDDHRSKEMPYWGSKSEDSDFAFDSVGAIIFLIKERMMKDIETVLKKSYPEQGMIASLACLRLLGERFPKNLSVHFRKKDFAFVKSAFEQWYQAVESQMPSKYRDEILAEARNEFALFEDRILSGSG